MNEVEFDNLVDKLVREVGSRHRPRRAQTEGWQHSRRYADEGEPQYEFLLWDNLNSYFDTVTIWLFDGSPEILEATSYESNPRVRTLVDAAESLGAAFV